MNFKPKRKEGLLAAAWTYALDFFPIFLFYQANENHHDDAYTDRN